MRPVRRWAGVFAVLVLVAMQQHGRRIRKRDEMSIRRCDNCAIDWPAINWTDKIPLKRGGFREVKHSFERCPQCLQQTSYMMLGKPIPKEEARRLASWAKFETFYATWERAREKRGDPSPEALGRLAALQIYELEQALELDLSDR